MIHLNIRNWTSIRELSLIFSELELQKYIVSNVVHQRVISIQLFY